jgi:hypothetical protein
MTTLIRVLDESGRETRRCDAKCHRASFYRIESSRCICGGRFRGIERMGIDPLSIPAEELNLARTQIELKPGEHVQLRIGA